MSKNNTPEGEPLYIIVLHRDQAETQLQQWVDNNRIQRASVVGKRLYIFNGYEFDKFRLTWTQGWHQLTVWDNWNRRLIYL
jgi:hypothetical protein